MKRPARIPRDVPAKSRVKAEAKRERIDAAHMKAVRAIGICAATGRVMPVDVHHLMRAEPGCRGMGLKSPGRHTIPLGRDVHMEITPKGDPEAYLMEKYGLDARALAKALRTVSGDADAMERATIRASQDARTRLRQRNAGQAA
jgi:hypothetical protein